MNPEPLEALDTIPRRTAHSDDIALERSIASVGV